MGIRTTRLRYTAVGLLLIGLILATWELSVRLGWLSQLALPLPTSVLQRGAEQQPERLSGRVNQVIVDD